VLLKDVRKSFGDVHAVKGLSTEIEKGCVYGLLGPNASGKSTTMRMIMGLVRPDSGEIRVLGHDPKADPLSVKRVIGHVPETPRLYEYLTGLEYLDFVGDVYGIGAEEKKDRIHEFIEAFGLEGREDEMMNGYSHGMKQKVAIIAAVLHRPRLSSSTSP
jgi:ABC-2 type transport system ATP-binding protein